MQIQRVSLFMTTVFITYLFTASPASAHGFEIHDRTNFMLWIIRILVITASIVTIWIWTRTIYSGFLIRDYKHTIRATTVLVSFIFWFLLIGVQNWILSITNNQFIYSVSFTTGYFVLPFALLALWRVIWPFATKHLSYILKIKSYRLLFVFSIVGYSIFYLFATGWIIPIDAEDPPITAGFVGFYENYGPLTFWPNVEFGLPILNLFGAISIGTLLMTITLSGFMAISIVLFVYGLRAKQQSKINLRALGNLTGSSLSLTATSFCCCCLPVLYPILSLMIGAAAADTVSLLLVSASGLLFNMVQMAVLSVMAFSVMSLSKNIDVINSGQCEI